MVICHTKLAPLSNLGKSLFENMLTKVVLTQNNKPNFSSEYMLKLNVLFPAAVALILLHRITGNSDDSQVSVLSAQV